MAEFINAEGAENVVNAASFTRAQMQRMSRETLEDLQGAVIAEKKRDPNRNPNTEFSLPQIDFLAYVHNCSIIDAQKRAVRAHQLATADRPPHNIVMASLGERVVTRYHLDIQREPSDVTLTDNQFNPQLSLLLRQIVKMRIQEGRPV